jgi:hypothetical protein
MSGPRSLRFELALLTGREAEPPVALGDLLDRTAGDAPAVGVDNATLLFEADGVDLMAHHWALGELTSLGQQFAAAATRLRAGEIAIVRSAVDDRDEVTSFLFEPFGSDVVVSQFLAPRALRFVYPTSPARGPELYEHVREHRDELRAPGTDHDIVGVTVPLAALADALEREADRAARVVARLTS